MFAAFITELKQNLPSSSLHQTSQEQIKKENEKHEKPSILGKGSYGTVFTYPNFPYALKKSESSEVVEYVITQYITTILKQDFGIDLNFINISLIKNFVYSSGQVLMQMDKQVQTLWDFQSDPSKLDFDRVMYQCAKGLYLIESAGILHLDIKPTNLLMDKDNNVYISDFGMYDSIEVLNETKYFAYDLDSVQTAQFRAYELFSERKSIDHLNRPFTFSVVWSLGMSLLTMFVKELEFYFEIVLTKDLVLYFYLFLSQQNHTLSKITLEDSLRLFSILRQTDASAENEQIMEMLQEFTFSNLEQNLSLRERFILFIYAIAPTNSPFLKPLDKLKISDKAKELKSKIFNYSHLYSTKYPRKFAGLYIPNECKKHSLQSYQKDWIESCLLTDTNRRITFEKILNSDPIYSKYTKPDASHWNKLWNTVLQKLEYTKPIRSFSSSSSKNSTTTATVTTTTTISKSLQDRLIRDYLHIWTLFPDRDSVYEQQIRKYFMQFDLIFEGQTQLAFLLLNTWFPYHRHTPLHPSFWNSYLNSTDRTKKLKEQTFIYFLNCIVERRCFNENLLNSVLSGENVWQWISNHYSPLEKSSELEVIQQQQKSNLENIPYITFAYQNSLMNYNKNTSLNSILAQTMTRMDNTEIVLKEVDFNYPTNDTLVISNQIDIIIYYYIFKFDKWKHIFERNSIDEQLEQFNTNPKFFWQIIHAFTIFLNFNGNQSTSFSKEEEEEPQKTLITQSFSVSDRSLDISFPPLQQKQKQSKKRYYQEKKKEENEEKQTEPVYKKQKIKT
jgi:serine/threonine protein kinase